MVGKLGPPLTDARLKWPRRMVPVAHDCCVTGFGAQTGKLRQITGKLGFNCCRDQLLCSRFQQFCQRVRHPVSTCKIYNVSRFHGGVSPLVGLLSHNNNSTRYAANLQTAQTPDSVIARRYGTSKLLFRGPRRSLNKPYLTFLGGTETYGKFIANPFPELVEQSIGRTCINLGCVNAGVDVFSTDVQITEMATGADVTVVQIMGAHNMSNRFYTVHPRRNDRFLKPSSLLQAIYREVDFAEFNFNKHMLQRLYTLSPGRFDTVVDELRQAWLARMRMLLGQIKGKTVLLWFADHTPDDVLSADVEKDPWFITRDMIEKLRPLATDVIEVVASPSTCALGTEGMVFNQMEAPVAKHLLGPAAHQEAAAAVVDCVRGLL